jgi:hypothetical protein
MTASPDALLAFLRDQAGSLTPAERSALLSFAEELDPALTPEKLISRLSRFLLDHPDLDRRLEDHPAERIAGQTIKLMPEAFITNVRNLVLQHQPRPPKNGRSTSKH